MPYLDEAGLSRYDPKLKEWISAQPAKTLPSTLYPWTLTEKAGAVACWPVGGTELKPVVDFLFTETGPAEGTKAPDNPSTITGVSSVKVTRCGNNLFTYPYYDSPQTINNVEWTVLSDGSVVANGTTPANTRSVFRVTYEKLLPAGTYTVYLNPGIRNVCDSYLTYGSTTLWGNANPHTFTLSTPQTVSCYLRVAMGAAVDNYKYTPQLEIGSISTEFEKGEGTDYTISLGSTYYGGTVDLATGVMTVTYYAHVFDGTEAITTFTVLETNGRVEFPLDGVRPFSDDYQYCSHLVHNASWTSDTAHFYVNAYQSGYSAVLTAPYLTQESFRAWLAQQYANGTPVKLVYRLYTPLTISLTPTQILSLTQTDKYTPRLNTIYTDASAVQVGYVKSPVREEYELQQAVVAQGGNI